MSIKALEGFTRYWFEPSNQEGDDKTRFEMEPLDSVQLENVLEGAAFTDQDELKAISAKGIKYCLKVSLKDWENFGDSKGDFEFSHAKFNLIPYNIRQSMSLDVVFKSVLPESAEKNS